MEKIKLTGLWKSQGKNGGQYLTGAISPSSRLLILPNTYKKTDKDPDYIAYVTQGKDGSTDQDLKDKQEQDQFSF